ncbi:hypothetical protein LEN26_017705 [Aphanomyces euteiches]|nr:hypothetical protein LEN26_017705 [Aphanomyces euteiches]KAH9119909.1 hypothetical protein AeMF1_007666 [Aphanomyces euteiches]KAH9184311.1 hypothetical protein AeNC1_013712 [Aphanomyces euteiches]
MKAAFVLALAAAAAADKVAVRLNRFFEANTNGNTEAVVTAPVLVKYKLDFAALESGAAASANPRQFVFDFLTNASKENLKTLSTIVNTKDVQSLWIGGAFYLPRATKETVDILAASNAIAYLDLNAVDSSNPPVITNTKESTRVGGKNEWGIESVGAPSIWKFANGTGAVVGSIDSGALYTHEAIKANWRSDNGWFDPYNKTTLPWDSDGHGSHTIGTMVGNNGIGVAPGAKWIACLGLYKGGGDSNSLLKCAQFMLCPTKPDGTGADCKKGPHVVNNSWGSDSAYSPWYEDAVAAWKAAGIIPVFANGNNGPACRTVGNPGGYKTVIGVGAIGSFDNEPNLLAYFSSKGPQATNGAAYVKPDVSGPGFWTRSVSIASNSAYREDAGTSMAAPHVSGVVAILKSVDPKLSYAQVYNYLTGTTDQRPLNTTEPTFWRNVGQFRNITLSGAPNCGSVKDTAWPNNRFGYGRVNVGTILRDGKLNSNRPALN